MATAVDRIELRRLIEFEGAQVVDVLPSREYDEAHIPRAFNLPLRELTARTASVLARDKPVVVYCHDGL